MLLYLKWLKQFFKCIDFSNTLLFMASPLVIDNKGNFFWSLQEVTLSLFFGENNLTSPLLH